MFGCWVVCWVLCLVAVVFVVSGGWDLWARGAMVGFELLGLLFALVWFCGWLRVVWRRMFW